MAQVIPSITSLPIDSSAAPSVEDIQDRLPSICVDYLSHEWNEEDVWTSWRAMARHKHEIANGVRLENASWRTWQKQRNKLKTVSPETLNWLKDSDVTWLYGPLHTANVEPGRKVSSPHDRLGIDGGASLATPGMKPILKHRTLSEILTYNNPSSPILEATGMDQDIMAGALDALGTSPGRPPLIQTRSDTNVLRAHVPSRRRSPPRGPIVTRNSGSTTPAEPVSGGVDSGKRHISFNTFVEQCVSVDDPSDIPVLEDSDSDDDVLEMRSSSFSSRGSRPSIARSSSTASGSQSENLTIAKIAPTMLKVTGSYASESLPQMVYAPPPEYLSPPLNAPQASPYDFPSPQVATRQRWPGEQEDEDEYDSVGFDYFAGNEAQQAHGVQSHVGQGSYRMPGSGAGAGQVPPPVVAQPPSQPKWRQASSPAQQAVVSSSPVHGTHLVPQVQGSDPSSISSSLSGSPRINASGLAAQPGAQGGLQPGRSILKVRTPQPEKAVSPPVGELDKEREREYFDYTPSVATGIGGMNAYGRPSPPGVPAQAQMGGYGGAGGHGGSPGSVPYPSHGQGQAQGQEGEPARGRSASRERGSALAGDRQGGGGSRTTSSSASTTSNASTSVSPGGGGPRSPLSEHHNTHGQSQGQGSYALHRRQSGQTSPPVLGQPSMPPSSAANASIASQLSPGVVPGASGGGAGGAMRPQDGHGPVQRDPTAQSSPVQIKSTMQSGTSAGAGGLGGVVAKDEVEQRREEKEAQRQRGQEERRNDDEDAVMLDDLDIPDRTTTPTPHSSPQDRFAPMPSAKPAAPINIPAVFPKPTNVTESPSRTFSALFSP